MVPLLFFRPTGRVKVTPREREILGWVVLGKKNTEIGMILKVGPRTISKHIEHIFKKLGVKTRTEAVVHYFGLESFKRQLGPGTPKRKESKVICGSTLPHVARKWGMVRSEEKSEEIKGRSAFRNGHAQRGVNSLEPGSFTS